MSCTNLKGSGGKKSDTPHGKPHGGRRSTSPFATRECPDFGAPFFFIGDDEKKTVEIKANQQFEQFRGFSTEIPTQYRMSAQQQVRNNNPWTSMPNAVGFGNRACDTNNHRLRSLSVSSSTTSTREPNVALKKTKLCDHWRRSGVCTYGENCWYAHGENDLRRNGTTTRETSSAETRNSMKIQPNMENDKVVVGTTSTAKKGETAKPADEHGKQKRTSTNIKNLTVKIPMAPTTTTTTTNDKQLPLSPAQERWISMTGSPPKSATSDADERSQLSNSSGSTVVLRNVENLSTKFAKLAMDEQHLFMAQPPPQIRTNIQAAFANRFANSSSAFNGNNNQMNVYNRPIGRAAPQAKNYAAAYGGGRVNPHLDAYGGYRQPSYFEPPMRDAYVPQMQRTNTNLVDEIYRRQRIVESGGELEALREQQAIIEQQRKNHELMRMYGVDDPYGLIGKANAGVCAVDRSAKFTPNFYHGLDYNANRPYPPAAIKANEAHYGYQHYPAGYGCQQQKQQPKGEFKLTLAPKITESLLPDEDFSIWLDKAEKKESAIPEKKEAKVSSLCELLFGETPMSSKKANSGVFNFDAVLKVSPSDKPPISPTPLFVIAEKTPNQDVAEKEICAFYSTSGCCPFGDSCALDHKLEFSESKTPM
ncbi:unnamed protein product [Caenorhabditis bovis]|uniref:C3H1-type domain-containing protein n=1 Tax=Caenorhabditis bovis TaxID=2654633 RepID=A0A8S1F9Y5_9PELO|nr:unnamed protein product [Caenorhabditis bovis]